MQQDRLKAALYWVLFGAISFGLFGYVFWQIFRPLAGTQVSAMPSRAHLDVGTKITYNSNLPTSGDHYEDPEEWGIYDKPLTMERLVHNLEHGGIIIYYNCENCDEMISQLKAVAERLKKRDPKVLMVPYKELDAKVALAAWRYFDKMEEVSEERIWKFFNDHINQGPEKVVR